MRELRIIAKELKNADLDVVQQVVVREVQKEQHVHFFQDGKALWCYLIGSPSPAFRELLKDGVNTFCSLYVDECWKGADRHMHSVAPCLEQLQCYLRCYPGMTTQASSRLWNELTSGYAGAITGDCRSAIMSAILLSLFTFIVQQRDLILE